MPLLGLLLASCAGRLACPPDDGVVPAALAVKANSPPRIDGVLDEPMWQAAPSSFLRLPGPDPTGQLVEAGAVQFAYDKTYLYVAVRLDDSDVVANGETHGLHHYLLGDLVELFIQPLGQTCYWELYVTPKSMRTAFFFPGGGRVGLPENITDAFPFEAMASVDGTLNNWSDRDRGWSAEMAIPVGALVRDDAAWRPGSQWRVFLGRYNYSRWLESKELSGWPRLPVVNFHLRSRYAVLELP